MTAAKALRRANAAGAAAVVTVIAAGTAPAVAVMPAAAAAPAATAAAPEVHWMEAHPAVSPPALRNAAAAYDGDTRTTVVFGGKEADGTLSDDTWVWNGTGWTEFPNAQPPARELASMAFDPTLHEFILYGGVSSDGTLLDDTWAWNGQQWSQLDQSGPAPSPREAAAFAYDAAGHLVLFGGTGAAPATSGANPPAPTSPASTTTPTTTPPTTDATTAAQVSAADVPAAGDSTASSTGTGDGTASADSTTAGADPSSAGSQGSTAPSTGTPSTGTPSTETGAPDAPESVASASTGTTPASAETTSATSTTTTAPPSGTTSGDVALSDTWEWTGSGWTQGPAAGPPARSGAQMAYDSAHHTTVLFSGETVPIGAPNVALAADTWTWNGSAWAKANLAPPAKPATPAAPATATKPAAPVTKPAPPARFGAVFDDDPGLGGPLLLAGTSQDGTLDDGWLWNGSGWVQAHIDGSSTPLANLVGAYDIPTSDYVLLGVDSEGAVHTEVVMPPSQPPPLGGAVQPRLAPATTRVPPAVVSPSGSKAGAGTTTPTITAEPHQTPTTTPSPTPGAAPRHMSLVANLHTVRQGASIQISGTGFQPGASITLMFHSAPELLGHSTADSDGQFTATVGVPRSAAPGQHHIIAEGMSPSGKTADLAAAVFVLAPGGSHLPGHFDTGVMIGLALLIPAAAWAIMNGSVWWRRRRNSQAGA